MTDKSEGKTVGVVGAGIVGLCCAHYLTECGFQVTLIDKGDPGRACSYGNAGILTATECGPLGLPGMLSSLPKWLLDPLGPVAVKPSYLPSLMPWGIRLIKESRPSRVERIADHMQSFYSSSVDLYRALLSNVGADELLRQNGYVCVYRDKTGADPDEYFWNLHRKRGIELQELSVSDIRSLIPSLNRDIEYAIFIPNEGRVLNPYGASKAILEKFVSRGGKFVRDFVKNIASTDRTVSLDLDSKTLEFDSVVVAAGIQSKQLARNMGYRVLLEAMRGYHAMIPDPTIDLQLPVLSGDYKFFASPMQSGLRLAGTAEFASHKTEPNYKRADKLINTAKILFPDLNTDTYSRWMGNRPMTPDSLPIVGEAPHHTSIYFAFGHGHNGLSGAPMTGRIVTDLISGNRPNLDLKPFSIERFR